MKLLVRWARGEIPLRIENLNDESKSVVRKLAEILKVAPSSIFLYSDIKCTKPLPITGTVLGWRLPSDAIIYMKVTQNVDTSIAQQAMTINDYKRYLVGEGDEMTRTMKQFRSEFGPRAVSLAFFEHRNLMKPHIDTQEESSCYAFRVGEEALTRFQFIAAQKQFDVCRLCFLFGRVNKITGKVTAHVACEPPQVNLEHYVAVDQLFDMNIPVEIAKYFGMTCCGMAVSHAASDKYPMNACIVRLAARYQNLFGEYFTTLIVKPNGETDVAIEAFQVSDIAMRLEKENYFVDLDSETELGFTESLYVGNRKQKQADVNIFLCAVRVRQTHSKFPLHCFPWPSQTPKEDDVKIHLRNHEYCPSWFRLFDFNLLVYLVCAKKFSKDEIADIITMIIHKQDTPDMYMERIDYSTTK